MTYKHIWYWIAPALLLVGCRTVEKTAYAPDQIVPTEKNLLWKISGMGLKKPSHLFGTIHMIPKEDFTLTPRVKDALEDAKRVAFEIDMKDMTNIFAQFSMLTKAMMRDGKKLRDLLSAEDYALVKQKMTDKGLPLNMFERVKPMFLSMALSNEDGGDPTKGGAVTSVEMELYKVARSRQMESAGLETMGYQMGLFDQIPYDVQAKMLVESLRSTDTDAQGGEDDFTKMVKLYLAQDIAAMQALIATEQGMKEYEDILLNQRNRNWIPVMGQLMQQKPTFFAVGAGHLGGSEGVVALLRRAGYKVEAVQ
jgi:uncharacterized protein